MTYHLYHFTKTVIASLRRRCRFCGKTIRPGEKMSETRFVSPPEIIRMHDACVLPHAHTALKSPWEPSNLPTQSHRKDRK